jgi:hypothetical protein
MGWRGGIRGQGSGGGDWGQESGERLEDLQIGGMGIELPADLADYRRSLLSLDKINVAHICGDLRDLRENSLALRRGEWGRDGLDAFGAAVELAG